MYSNAMLELNKAVVSAVTTYKVYSEGAPDDATYPYVTMEMSNTLVDAENTEVCYLYIDGWDNYSEANGTVRIETMMAYVVSQLHKKTVSNNNMSFTFYLDTRKAIRDSDLNIRRRRAQFMVRIITE